VAKMNMTDHAKVRQKQRGISNIALDIIEKNGRCEKAPGGALKIFFGFKEYQRTIQDLKRTIQMLDKVKGGTLIINEDKIVTVYKN
jgi:type II restriction/modification system DNA methylase subunit YeeA